MRKILEKLWQLANSEDKYAASFILIILKYTEYISLKFDTCFTLIGQDYILWGEVKGHMNNCKNVQNCRDLYSNVRILLKSKWLFEVCIYV